MIRLTPTQGNIGEHRKLKTLLLPQNYKFGKDQKHWGNPLNSVHWAFLMTYELTNGSQSFQYSANNQLEQRPLMVSQEVIMWQQGAIKGMWPETHLTTTKGGKQTMSIYKHTICRKIVIRCVSVTFVCMGCTLISREIPKIQKLKSTKTLLKFKGRKISWIIFDRGSD